MDERSIGSVDEALDRVERRLRVLERAAVCVVLVAGRDRARWDAALAERLSRLQIPREQVLVVDADAAAEPRLEELNRQRDILLRTHRLVVLIAADGEGLRRIGRVATDLTAALDLHFEVAGAPVMTSPEERAARVAELARATETEGWRLDERLLRPRDLFGRREAVRPLLMVGASAKAATAAVRSLAAAYREGRDPLEIGAHVAVAVPGSALDGDRVREPRRAVVEWFASHGVDLDELIGRDAGGVALILDGATAWQAEWLPTLAETFHAVSFAEGAHNITWEREAAYRVRFVDDALPERLPATSNLAQRFPIARAAMWWGASRADTLEEQHAVARLVRAAEARSRGELRAVFGARPIQAVWERMLPAAEAPGDLPDDATPWRVPTPEVVAGPLIAVVPRALPQHGLSPDAVVDDLRGQSDWRLRYAGWAAAVRPGAAVDAAALNECERREPAIARLLRLWLQAGAR